MIIIGSELKTEFLEPTLIYRFFSCYQSLDALEDIPTNFGGVGKEEMPEAVTLA